MFNKLFGSKKWVVYNIKWSDKLLLQRFVFFPGSGVPLQAIRSSHTPAYARHGLANISTTVSINKVSE
jgi:hypothetical protein